MLRRHVLPDPADVDLVLARDIVWSRVEPRVGVVLDDHAGCAAEQRSGFVGADPVFGFDEQRLAVADRDWHPNAGGRDAQIGLVEDLPRLVDDLDLLLVVPAGLRVPAAGHDVVRELIGVDSQRRLCAFGDRFRLLLELVDEKSPGARRRLVGGHEDALEPDLLLQRVEDDDEWDGAAIGVGDDALVSADVLGIDLGHHERHVCLHPPGRAVVDDEGAGLRRDRPVHQSRVAARGEECDVDALERGFGDLPDLELAPVVGDGHAFRPLRSEGDDALTWKVSLRQDAKYLGPDHPGRADDSNV